MEFPRDSIDLAHERYSNSAMDSSTPELTNNAASPPTGPVSSPVTLTPFDEQRASFRSSITSPRSSGSHLEQVRSRGSSLSSAISEKLGLDKIFRSSRRKSKRNKPYRDKAARPLQPNILDKPTTNKLTKFWSVTEGRVGQSPRASFNAETPSLPSISFEGAPYRLASIAEDPPTLLDINRRCLGTMDPSRLAPDSSQQHGKKQKAVQDAKDMYQLVRRNCERNNTQVPPYDFIELIGKGAFGRVYKCKDRNTGNLVAIKIVNTDEVDYQQDSLDKDDTIRDFRKEVTILQQLKDSNAKNVNMIHDAFDLQEQLWIVSDYCTGGSVRTLMRAQPATHPGLEEQYIIPIARELALALKSVHDIGVIHRDIKCTNVYVTEEGEIQLGDFGIVGVLDDGVSKRQTMIGTPHYMPREMHIHGSGNQVAEGYGTEIDVWSFGCSVYEMATGVPPNATKRQDTLKNELLSAPRLEGGRHSQELRDFIAFCLNSDPKERPTADQILRHPYVVNSTKRYPTRNLVELIHRYKTWEYSGGWRQSLFFAGGAAPVAGTAGQLSEQEAEELDDWNFSTSESFNEAFEKRYSQMMLTPEPHGPRVRTQSTGTLPQLDTNLTAFEQIQRRQKDLSASRGERSLERIFTPEGESYELHTPIDIDDPGSPDDLPLRKLTAGAPTRESHIMIDLDTAGDEDLPTDNFDFGDGPTLRAKGFRASTYHDEEDDYQYGLTEEDREKRATMDWKFPGVKRATMDWKFPSAEPADPKNPEPIRPMLKHTVTEPVGQFSDYVHPVPQRPTQYSPVRESVGSMIDLDLGLSDPADIVRPSTASSTAGSTMTDATSGNPFDLEDDPLQNEIDRNRFSYHKQWQSEGGQVKRSSHRSIPMHTRGSSLSSTASELERPSTAVSDDVFDYDYSRSVSESMRAQLNGTLHHDSVDLNQWPDFGADSGFDRMRAYTDSLDDTSVRDSRTYVNGNAYRRPSTVDQDRPEIEFPRIEGPHPEALREDAAPNVLMSEFDRLMDDFIQGANVTVNALQQLTIHGNDEETANGSNHETKEEAAL